MRREICLYKMLAYWRINYPLVRILPIDNAKKGFYAYYASVIHFGGLLRLVADGPRSLTRTGIGSFPRMPFADGGGCSIQAGTCGFEIRREKSPAFAKSEAALVDSTRGDRKSDTMSAWNEGKNPFKSQVFQWPAFPPVPFGSQPKAPYASWRRHERLATGGGRCLSPPSSG